MGVAKERIRKLKDSTIEITQSDQERKNRGKKKGSVKL